MRSELNELLPALQRGDHEAWETLYLMCGNYMFRFALRLTRNKEKAVDISNDAYLAVRRNGLKNCDYLTQGYLGTVVYHEFCRVIREKKRPKEISFEALGGKNDEGKPQSYDPEDPNQPDLNDMIDKPFNSEVINEAMDRLSEKERRVIQLRYFEGLETVEILEVTKEKKLNTVQKQLRAARNKIKEYYLREDPS
ncbi:RNA polymerase sigma factor [Gimesia sp.]|uniref:RNA polymerase sigma factor n=1 Tax=Gimesia sp. TaxID=2024833 RepID=UPI003A8F7996